MDIYIEQPDFQNLNEICSENIIFKNHSLYACTWDLSKLY